MPAVESTIRVSIPEGGATLREVEAAVAQAAEEAGRRPIRGTQNIVEAPDVGLEGWCRVFKEGIAPAGRLV